MENSIVALFRCHCCSLCRMCTNRALPRGMAVLRWTVGYGFSHVDPHFDTDVRDALPGLADLWSVAANCSFAQGRMTSQHDKAKRWRPRFSVRTLVIIITLVCCYAACWGPTETRGVDDVINWIYRDIHFNIDDRNPGDPRFLATFNRAWSPAPFLVTIKGPAARGVPIRRYYFFWFFGHVSELPFETAPQL